MIRAGRTPCMGEWSTPSEHPVRLHGLRWWLMAGRGRWGWIVAYDRPLAVEAGGKQVRVHDPIVALRLLTIVLIMVSIITRRSRQ